eukprot:517775-Rhodomonas_salina.1
MRCPVPRRSIAYAMSGTETAYVLCADDAMSEAAAAAEMLGPRRSVGVYSRLYAPMPCLGMVLPGGEYGVRGGVALLSQLRRR